MCAGYDLKSELDRIEKQAAEAKKKAVHEVCVCVCVRAYLPACQPSAETRWLLTRWEGY